jgi:hypothetical protein
METKKFSSPRIIDTLGMAMILLIILQYILGMYANLFVEIPEGTSGWAFVGNSSLLFSHIVVGLLVMGFAVAHLVLSFRKRKTAWVFFSVMGLLSILAALFAGTVFMGEEADSYSFIMAVGTGISLLAYSAGIYYAAKYKE